MMTSRIKAEDELRDVVILQQLSDTDLFSKLGYLFPSLKLELHHCVWPKFCQLLQSTVLNFCVWWNNVSRKSCLVQTGKCYKEGESVVCFPSDRHGEGGGGVFLLWWPALFLFCFFPDPQRWVCLSVYFIFLTYFRLHNESPLIWFLCCTFIWICNLRYMSQLQKYGPHPATFFACLKQLSHWPHSQKSTSFSLFFPFPSLFFKSELSQHIHWL